MNSPASLRAIARAGAEVNNIPVERCSEAGIVVLNAPGANANAVKELVICAMLLASRDIVGGVEWAKTQANTDALYANSDYMTLHVPYTASTKGEYAYTIVDAGSPINDTKSLYLRHNSLRKKLPAGTSMPWLDTIQIFCP